jgi:hypothetical protein
MARYGAGYSTDITKLMANIELSVQIALVEAWDMFCERLQKIVDEFWDYWILEVYEYDPDYYERTYQLDKSHGCPFKVVNKSNGIGVITNGNGTVVAGFEVDDLSSIGITNYSNPPYNVIRTGGSTEDFVNAVGAKNGNVISFVDELKQYLNTTKWQDLYRQCCKDVGLTLN